MQTEGGLCTLARDLVLDNLPNDLHGGHINCTRDEILFIQDYCVKRNGYDDVISFLPREANGKIIFSASKFPTDVVFIEFQNEPSEIHCDIGIADELENKFPGLFEKKRNKVRLDEKVIFKYTPNSNPERIIRCTRTEILLVQDCCVNLNGYTGVISFIPREENGKLIFSASKFPTDVVFIEFQEEPAEIHCNIGIADEIGHRFPALDTVRAQAKSSARVHFLYRPE